MVLARGAEITAPMENHDLWSFLALSRWEGQPAPLAVGSHTTCIGTFQPGGRWRVELHRGQTILALTDQIITPQSELISWALVPESVLNCYAQEGHIYPNVIFVARPWDRDFDPQDLRRIFTMEFGVKTAALVVSLVGSNPSTALLPDPRPPEPHVWYDGPLGVIGYDSSQTLAWLAYYPGGGSALLTVPASIVAPKSPEGVGASLEDWLVVEKSWAVKQRCLISFLAHHFSCSLSNQSSNTISVSMDLRDFHVRTAVVLILLCQGAPESILQIQVNPTHPDRETDRQQDWHPEPLWRKFFHHLGAHWKLPTGSNSPTPVPLSDLLGCLQSLSSQDLVALCRHLNQRSTLIPQTWIESLSDQSPQGLYEQP